MGGYGGAAGMQGEGEEGAPRAPSTARRSRSRLRATCIGPPHRAAWRGAAVEVQWGPACWNSCTAVLHHARTWFALQPPAYVSPQENFLALSCVPGLPAEAPGANASAFERRPMKLMAPWGYRLKAAPGPFTVGHSLVAISLSKWRPMNAALCPLQAASELR